MYNIIGGDQKEYGPVSADQICRWIAENRLNAQSKVQAEGSSEWKPLAAFPEFSDALGAYTTAQSAGKGVTTPPPPFPAGGSTGTPASITEGDYQLDLGGYISQGWRLVKTNFGVLFGGFVIYALIMGAISALGSIPLVGLVFPFVGLVVTGPLLGGLWVLFLHVIRGEAAAAGDVFAGFRRSFAQLFLGYIVPSLLAVLCLTPALMVASITVLPAVIHHHEPNLAQSILVFATMLLCILPVIFLHTSWMFTLPLIIDRQMDFWLAMKTSWRKVNQHWWQVFGLAVLVGLVNLAGLVACCVGILVTFPIGLAAMMYAYETIFSGKAAQAG